MRTTAGKLTLVIGLAMIGLLFTGLSYAAINPATIVGIWTFDEGSGDVAGDSSGNGNDGTVNGDPQWIDGQFGSALEFNGDDSVIVEDSDSLDMTDQSKEEEFLINWLQRRLTQIGQNNLHNCS